MLDQPEGLAGTGAATSVEEPIFVRSEWGELKECVYGGYDQYVFPKFLQDADVRPSGAFSHSGIRTLGRCGKCRKSSRSGPARVGNANSVYWCP